MTGSHSTRTRAFSLVEAVIATGFVAVSLAGILSLAPVLVRGQNGIARATLAQQAAAELIATADPSTTAGTSDQQPADVAALLQGLREYIAAAGPAPSTFNPRQTLNTTHAGFPARIEITVIDPTTLAPAIAPTGVYHIRVAIFDASRKPLAIRDQIHAAAWHDAVARREFTQP